MKKALLAAFLLAGGNMFAAFVQCTPNQGAFLNAGAGAFTDFTCSPSATAGNIAGDGLNVVSITILVSGTAHANVQSPSTFYSASLVATNNGGLTNPAQLLFSCTTNVDGNCTSGPQTSTQSSSVGPVDEFGVFTVTVTGTPGSPSFNSGTDTVSYLAATQAIPTPEPITLPLMSAGLVFLGVLGRRLAKK